MQFERTKLGWYENQDTLMYVMDDFGNLVDLSFEGLFQAAVYLEN